MNLIVTEPFAEYKRGDQITDPELVAEILEGEHAPFVVKVAPQVPQAEAQPE